jgi:hypothetical protein
MAKQRKHTTQWPNKGNTQHNGQTKETQRSTNITHKTKDRVTQTPLKSAVNTVAPEELAVPAPLVAPVVLLCYNTGMLYCIMTQVLCTIL